MDRFCSHYLHQQSESRWQQAALWLRHNHGHDRCSLQFDRLETDSDIVFEEAREWFQLNRTSINNSKNQQLLCTMKKVDTASVKLLGFFIDKSLSWEDHVYFLSVKLLRTVFLLHRLKQEDGVY